jgi:hypothetical protein
VACRVDERAARAGDGQPQAVVDRAVAELVVAGQSGQDREARRVGRGPARGAKAVRAQAPGRTRAGAPALASAHRVGGKELPQPAAVAVDDEHVAIAVGARAALERRLRGMG